MPYSSPICTDASLVVRLLAGLEGDAASQLWNRSRGERRLLVTPLLLRYEVANALHRYRHVDAFTDEEGVVRMWIAEALPIRLHSEADLHVEALQLARRFNFPAAYDAHYLALSLRVDAEFWMADRRLARAVAAFLPRVHLLEP